MAGMAGVSASVGVSVTFLGGGGIAGRGGRRLPALETPFLECLGDVTTFLTTTRGGEVATAGTMIGGVEAMAAEGIFGGPDSSVRERLTRIRLNTSGPFLKRTAKEGKTETLKRRSAIAVSLFKSLEIPRTSKRTRR